ncbi:hypothetical protein ABT299_39945 [Spirillospora sp. NPDC000708]
MADPKGHLIKDTPGAAIDRFRRVRAQREAGVRAGAARRSPISPSPAPSSVPFPEDPYEN